MTTLFVTAQEAPVLPAAYRGSWDDTASAKDVLLGTAKAGSANNLRDIPETSTTDPWDILLLRAVSPPLDAQLIDGTFDVAITAQESGVAMNAHWHIHAYVMAPDGTVRGTLLADYTESLGTNEFPTAAAGHALTAAQTLSGVTATAGDRIVLELGVAARNTSGSVLSATLGHGGTGADQTAGGSSSNASNVAFSDTITFQAESAPGSRWYLNNAAAPYSPATFKGGWDDTTGAITQKLAKTKAGANTSTGVAEANATNPYDVCVARFVSDPLASQTIDGWMGVVIGAVESSFGLNAATYVHAWVTQGDSDTVRGTLVADQADLALDEWNITALGIALFRKRAVTPTAVTAGDRLVVELGYRGYNSSATSFTGTIRYGGTAAGTLIGGDTNANATTLAGHVDFAGNILLASEAGIVARGQAVVVI